MKHHLPLWPLVVLLMYLPGAARATAGPPVTGRPLAEALNPDGTLRAGAAGSFDARQFTMSTTPDGRPVFRPAGTAATGSERWADGFGLVKDTDGIVNAIVQAGGTTYVGGGFATAGSARANGIARWTGTAWASLGTYPSNGVNGNVTALAVAGTGDLYVGGTFTQAGGAPATHVARWNGRAWSALGTGTANGVSGSVAALAVASTGDLYVGGSFTQAGGVAASNIARWTGTGWSALGTGVGTATARVTALTVTSTGDLYVGGTFTSAGGAAANNIARWTGTGWSALGTGTANGVSGGVTALAVAGTGDLYVGGTFAQAGGAAANNVARWTGAAWSALGTGTANGVDANVAALVVVGNGDVYVGGSFATAGGMSATGMSRWTGTAWSALGTANGLDRSVLDVAVAGNGDVYVCGLFTRAGGVPVTAVAKWNGTVWSALGSGSISPNGSVTALAVAGTGDLYVGGTFSSIGGVAANNVARWTGTGWSALGTGVGTATARVTALTVTSTGDLYVGGTFTSAGGAAANNIARWTGTGWSALGTGTANGVSGGVTALAVAGTGDLYVGGSFTQAGSIAANRVARWDGTTWNSVGTGLGNGVGDPTSGSNPAVYALAVATNGDLYVGGSFAQAGGATADGLAKWNGTVWSTLGNFGSFNNLRSGVSSLALASNGDLYVAGAFHFFAAYDEVLNIARWDGAGWSSLGSGLNIPGGHLAFGPQGKLYVGGNFISSSDKFMYYFGIYDPNAPLLGTAGIRATPAAQLFPNPAHGTATLRLPATAARQPLTLTDALGRLVRQYPAPAGPEAVLDLRGLPAGTYLLRCGELSQRLVVE